MDEKLRLLLEIWEYYAVEIKSTNHEIKIVGCSPVLKKVKQLLISEGLIDINGFSLEKDVFHWSMI